ncbi:MAG: UDP-2,4-diacetamido-2,4,6-trideoxy-beta-L-altropyranose hydrolase, partial [Aureispira sp.]|nr:UDP-2,4-diacetamido-2,4,6-trideoxy-beta-L-altropyranose hydrolase [Aureispira sp.]
MSKIYFRADGNSQIGLGHIFRSLALATMLKNDFECIFVIRNPLDTLKPKIQAVANLIELPEPTDELEEATHLVNSYLSEQDIVVLDGYHFKTSYQEVIKTAGVKLVSIDDIYECHFLSDAIINHAGGITPDYYNNQFYTQFYLGLNYLLLRPVFLEAAQTPYTKTDTNNIFICMGGADTNNNTIDILHKIEQKWTADDITCYVVIGQAYLHKKELENVIADSSLTIKVLSNLSAEQMLYYMQLCPIAICPPSGITFEYLCTAGALYLY